MKTVLWLAHIDKHTSIIKKKKKAPKTNLCRFVIEVNGALPALADWR